MGLVLMQLFSLARIDEWWLAIDSWFENMLTFEMYVLN